MSFHFPLNGIIWRVERVAPNSYLLIDRTNTLTVATTDTKRKCIYIANNLEEEFAVKVFIHELAHATLFSYDLLSDIRQMVKPQYIIQAEEFVCNFLADYGIDMFDIAYRYFGNEAIYFLPKYFENLVG